MLRITKSAEMNFDGTKLRLDGNLVGPWVLELMLLCEPILAAGGTLRLDCAGVSFVDGDGISLMHRLQDSGADLMNCSPFIKLQLGPKQANVRKTE
jgi:ABC-type transporter Mla MlaB component